MSSSQDTCLPESTEIDSEGSSCEERDTHKRLLGSDPDSLPKKRRKQSTPVKFSTSLSAGDESDDEQSSSANNHERELQGKPCHQQQNAKSIQASSMKDENLNNEFRCQFCSQFFDSRVNLELHLECEHTFVRMQPNNRNSPETQMRMSPETSSSLMIGSEQPISPINLTGISIRSFAASTPWSTSQDQFQGQNEDTLIKIASKNNNHFQSIPPGFTSSLAQFLPIPGFPMPDPGQLQRAAIGQFPKIFNPDAYCDLCNKEFCNKYFLKTHKANKHGIYGDPPSNQSQSSDGGSSSPFITSSSPLNNLQNNVKISENQSQRMEMNGLLIQQPTFNCDTCLKGFKNEDSLKKHRQKIHQIQNHSTESSQTQISVPSPLDEDERQSPSGMERLFKQEFIIEPDEVTYPSNNLSPKSSQMDQFKEPMINAEKLRRLGVMNPESFCELCYKEFCNKYFLRAHKLKKHGIFIPDDDGMPNTPTPWHQIQTSPLNLIVANAIGSNSDPEDCSDECACKICGIRLQTQNLYTVHVEKIHDAMDIVPSAKLDEDNELVDKRTDTISEDLQKLQTMILQLNGLESNGWNKMASCALCRRDYDTPALLRNHMQIDHGVCLNDYSPQQVSRERESPTTSLTQSVCGICEKEFANQEILRKHISEEHRPSTPTRTTPQLPSSVASTPKSNSSQPMERKPTANVTPTSSYCEICNKELCNKYFMKTHMQKMHGIEIENGAQIGGVVCNICKKELCSKYFLRVHKQNTHGIVEDGASGNKQENPEAPGNPDDVALKPEQLGDLSLRYITHFTEVCPICNRRFRSSKWLKVHLQGEHGKAGIDKWREIEQFHQTLPKTPSPRALAGGKGQTQHQQQQLPPNQNSGTTLRIPNGFETNNQVRADLAALGNQVLSSFFGNPAGENLPGQSYQCSQPQCNFSTTILPLFFLHERSHNHQQESQTIVDNETVLRCPICTQSFTQPEALRDHVLSRHPHPFPGLLSQFPLPLLNEFPLANDQHQQIQPPERVDFTETKEDFRQPDKTMANENVVCKTKVEESTVVQVMPQGAYKCSQCGFATANLNRIKKHIRKDHKCLGDPAETALAELSKTLKDVANKHKVPASYAVPQDANSTLEKTIMQAFIIEELENSQNGGVNCCGNDNEPFRVPKRFAPALVFLPVKTRVNGSLTLSFTLNPA